MSSNNLHKSVSVAQTMSTDDNSSNVSQEDTQPQFLRVMDSMLSDDVGERSRKLPVPLELPQLNRDLNLMEQGHAMVMRTTLDCLNLRANGRRKSQSVMARLNFAPTAPVYGADWNLKVQPAGTIGFIHWYDDPGKKGVNVSEFQPGLGSRRQPVYRKKKCLYRPDANAEEAGFVPPKNKLLGQWTATAICGNDITSSVIYTAGLVSATAGYYTPICLFLVVCLLHFFRNIYVEVVTALPLNGGTYTAILNTTRKGVAIIAACMSFLSYASTVVISAVSAMEYLHGVWHGLDIVLGTIVVVLLFAALMLVGIRESGFVALVIFAFHMLCLLCLISCSIAYTVSNRAEHLIEHFHRPGPENPPAAIAIGFSTAMLGITGFESSANFVQHQSRGVFAKTLRNMWIIVAVINPLISVLGFGVIPYEKFYMLNNSSDQAVVSRDVNRALLAFMAREMAGFINGLWLEKVVIADAIIVLCGAVLTGYVGVVGLLRRMVDDDIFPRACAATMPMTGANYPIIVFFCAVCITLILATMGRMESISGVYTVSFLSVMFLFCVSNLVLKHTRRELKREVKAKWYVVILCMAALTMALAGNCVAEPIIIGYAAVYIAIFMAFFYCMFARTFIIRCILNLTERMVRKPLCLRHLREYMIALLLSIEQVPVVFFSRRLNTREMNLAIQRVIVDELTRHLTIVHFYENLNDIPSDVNYRVRVLDVDIYPNIRVDVVLIKGRFGPGAVRLTECILEVPPNRMFIASPSSDFAFDVAELGSVRIIMSRHHDSNDENEGRHIANGSASNGNLLTVDNQFSLRRSASVPHREHNADHKNGSVAGTALPGAPAISVSTICSRSSSARVLLD